MKLYFLSVGYGEAIVALDDRHCLVIDGGVGMRDPVYQDRGTISLASFLKQKEVKQIDLMICSHLHNDHIGGLADAAEQFPVKEFWINIWPQSSPETAIGFAEPECAENLSLRLFTEGLRCLNRLRRALEKQQTPVRVQTQTDSWQTLWDGCDIRLFGMDTSQVKKRTEEFEEICSARKPGQARDLMRRFDQTENRHSLAFDLRFDGWSAFLTGDLCSGWDERCADPTFRHADVLKLTHHGQKDGMPQSLVDACDPSVFVMCTDAARTFTSACDEVQQRCKDYLEEKNREKQIYVTGLLAEAFPKAKNACVLVCERGKPVFCSVN
jgi:beta-lactamase superfamily II metal-dependent hydrolase